MAKFLKVILFLILAAAFCGSVSDAFTVQTVDEITIAAQTGLGEEGNAQRNDVRQGSYIPAPQLPYLSDAELASSAGTTQLLTFSRAQRSYTTEYILSLKDMIERLAHRTVHYRCIARSCLIPAPPIVAILRVNIMYLHSDELSFRRLNEFRFFLPHAVIDCTRLLFVCFIS